ncbi:MAG: hypothetical protein WCK29_00925 [archaeon]
MDNLVYKLELEIKGMKLPGVIEVHDALPVEKQVLYLNDNFKTIASIESGYYVVTQVVRSLDLTFSDRRLKRAEQLDLPVVFATYFGRNRPPKSE